MRELFNARKAERPSDLVTPPLMQRSYGLAVRGRLPPGCARVTPFEGGEDMASVVLSDAAAEVPLTIRLSSSAFADGELMAQRYTCDGTNASPPLNWEGVPEGSAELVLICEDPDPAIGSFVHWLVSGLDPIASGVEEDSLPEGVTVGRNDFGQAAYGGPCPPHGHEAHHYVFTLLAVGAPLAIQQRFTADELVTVLQHATILGKGQLVARYGRTDLSGPRPPAHTG